jgi:beta-lactamase regulating signal transducer with metallopeptidase domain
MIAQLNDIAQIWWQWMAGMFWQVSLFIILVTLLDMAIRRWAWPQVRYVLWGLVFLKLIIPPTWQMPTSVVSWIQPKVEQQIPFRIETRNVLTINSQASVTSMPSPTQTTKPVVATEKASWQAMVLLTWLAGMIAFGLMLIIKMSRLPNRSKKQDEQNAPEWFNELLINSPAPESQEYPSRRLFKRCEEPGCVWHL